MYTWIPRLPAAPRIYIEFHLGKPSIHNHFFTSYRLPSEEEEVVVILKQCGGFFLALFFSPSFLHNIPLSLPFVNSFFKRYERLESLTPIEESLLSYFVCLYALYLHSYFGYIRVSFSVYSCLFAYLHVCPHLSSMHILLACLSHFIPSSVFLMFVEH